MNKLQINLYEFSQKLCEKHSILPKTKPLKELLSHKNLHPDNSSSLKPDHYKITGDVPELAQVVLCDQDYPTSEKFVKVAAQAKILMNASDGKCKYCALTYVLVTSQNISTAEIVSALC